MRLFHVSEEPNIEVFYPRIPARTDIDQENGLVWAIEENKLSNFLTPRNCPRVGYHLNDKVDDETKKQFFSSLESSSCIVIEDIWLNAMLKTTLYIYEFDIADFYLQDSAAGYYVSQKSQKPINKIIVSNIFDELLKRKVEVRIVPSLELISSNLRQSKLDWSLCRMKYAKHNIE